ncbi:MAG: hypothetical protein J6B07_04000 [Opitutales bacterium]|nr:hypothetical protein [Opitutales bacterium]
MKKQIVFFCICTFVCSLWAQTAQEYLMLGNNSYKNGDYNSAKESYQNAINKGGASAQLFFNMANTCAKLNKKGQALLYYMKALVEEPRLREAEANLKLFAKDNSIQLPDKSSVDMYLLELSEFEWIIVCVVAFWFTISLFLIPRMYVKRTSVYIFLGIIFAIVTATAVIGIVRCNNIANTAIALTDDVELRLSPTPNAPVESVVQEGTFANILKNKGNYIYVQAPSGKRGWTNKKEFVPICE